MILDRNGETVKGADHGSGLGEMLIELTCALQCAFKEDFGEAVGQVLCSRGGLAEGDGDFERREATGGNVFEDGGRVEGNNVSFAIREDRAREVDDIEL